MTLYLANPYSGQDFFGFFAVLFQRLFLWLGGMGSGAMASDEVQCLVLICLGFSLAFLGSFLVLKQMTMLANALSHTLLVGLVLAFLLLNLFEGGISPNELTLSMKTLWIAACITGVLTTVLTQGLVEKFHLPADGSIALVFTTLFALGILLVTIFTKNTHLGVEAVMGNIDALHVDDVKLAARFSCIVGVIFLFFFRGFFAVSFDPVFVKTVGFPVQGLSHLLMILTAGGAVVSFRAVGVLLFLAFLVGPVLIARVWTHSLKKLVALSFSVSVFCSLIAVALSRYILTAFHISISTAGLVVCVIFIFYGVVFLFSPRKGLLRRLFRKKRHRMAIDL